VPAQEFSSRLRCFAGSSLVALIIAGCRWSSPAVCAASLAARWWHLLLLVVDVVYFF